jgi:hypothetical protein
MTKTLLLATVIVAIAGPAIAGCDDAAPRLRAHCWQLQFERSHDGMRKFAMRGLNTRAGPWGCFPYPQMGIARLGNIAGSVSRINKIK